MLPHSEDSLEHVSPLEEDLLIVLAAGELHSQQVLAAFGEVNSIRPLSRGSLYPTIASLRQKQCIQSRTLAEPGGRRRKYYSITDRGLDLLECARIRREKLAEWQAHYVEDKSAQSTPSADDPTARSVVASSNADDRESGEIL
ncbi:PadR family transcriptional regulator [Gloeobacter morelensis]|uniref:PadR family transcriptional regulator n=1 Tax=Gloeobacter morelensis TaxID=2907343 RepID=UPI003AB98027|nr:helix-turn-helix transcriptional regulator [Gloeobacter morelensis MG652769]